MVIFYFSNAYNIGGGERNLIDVATEMKNRGNKVIVFIPCTGALQSALEDKNISFFCYNSIRKIERRWLNFIPLFVDLGPLYRILYWCKKHSVYPNVIHSNTATTLPLVYMLAKLLNAMVIWTCHGPWEAPRGLKAKVMNFMADKSISITSEISKLNRCKNQVIIPLGIPMLEKNEVNNKHDIVCIGRFEHVKGQDILVKAFNLVHRVYPMIKLHFYGGIISDKKADKSFYDTVVSLVDKYGLTNDIVFHGYVDNIRKILPNYSVLCIPSRYESFSIVALEGLMLGMDIVASDIGGPSYLIENNKSGLLFIVGDENDLANKICSLLSKKCIFDKKNIYDRGARFSIDRQVDKLLEVYKRNGK